MVGDAGTRSGADLIADGVKMMKRDMDLVRRILLAIEESAEPDLRHVLHFPDAEHARVNHHFHILKQSGLVAIVDRSTHGAEYLDVYLTWAGYEFLDAIRDEGRWAQLKARSSELGLGSAAMLMDLSRAMAMQQATPTV